MNDNIIEYMKIRLTYLIELCYIVNHNMFNGILLNHDNIKDYNEILLEYEIIKTDNNKIVCMNKDFKIIDINKLSLNQIGLMRIKYNKFNVIFPNNKNDLTTEYIIKIKEDIRKIIDEIKEYHKNSIEYDKINKEISYTIDYIEKNKTHKYIPTNIKYYMDKFDNAYNLDEKTKILSNIYTFIYNNFDNMKTERFKHFLDTVYNQLHKNRSQILINIHNNIDTHIIEDKKIDFKNKYLIIFRIIKYLFMKKFSKEYLDNIIENKLDRQKLLDEELKILNLIDII